MMGAEFSLLTPPKAECCGTAPCGDGGGTFLCLLVCFSMAIACL